MRKFVVLISFLILVPLAHGAGCDSTVGTWKLNLAKSNFGKVRKPKAATLFIADDRDRSLKFTYVEVASDGKVFKMSYAGAYDGKQYPVRGSDPTGAGGWKLKSGAFTRRDSTEHVTWMMKDGSTSTETSTCTGDTIVDSVNEQDGSTITVVYERAKTRPTASRNIRAK